MTSHWELIALAVVVLLLFGSKQVPAIARSLGRSARDVKETMADIDPREDVRRALEPPKEPEPAAAERDSHGRSLP